MEELIEFARLVVGERWPLDETVLQVKGDGRLECRPAAGLEAQRPPVLHARPLDQVLQERRGNPPSQESRMRAHRFHLAGDSVDPLERGDPGDRFALPEAPDLDLRVSKPGEVEHEGLAWRGSCPHIFKVESQQRLGLGA